MTTAFPDDQQDDDLEQTPPEDLGQAWFDLLWPDEDDDLGPEPGDFDLDDRDLDDRDFEEDPTAA